MKALRTWIKRRLPPAYVPHLEAIAWRLRLLWHLRFGRPVRQGETSKARLRREREGFFDAYCRGRGLDIGYGGDLVAPNALGFDIEHGDAAVLPGIPRGAFDFVYSSHLLEHMPYPDWVLPVWWECVKPGGFLILYVPERDLYEKRRARPSAWAPDHQWFFLLDRDDPPHTLGVLPLIRRCLSGYEIAQAKICSEGHTIADPGRHSDGEYSIEVVIRKLPADTTNPETMRPHPP